MVISSSSSSSIKDACAFQLGAVVRLGLGTGVMVVWMLAEGKLLRGDHAWLPTKKSSVDDWDVCSGCPMTETWGPGGSLGTACEERCPNLLGIKERAGSLGSVGW